MKNVRAELVMNGTESYIHERKPRGVPAHMPRGEKAA